MTEKNPDIDPDDLNFQPVIVPQFEVGCRHSFDLNHFTSMINISPTRLWFQSIPHLIGIPGVPQCSWQYQFDVRHSEVIESSVEDVVTFFYQHKDITRPFFKKNNLNATVYLRVYVTIGVDDYPFYPLLEVPRKLLNKLAKIGAGFQIDVFPIDRIDTIEGIIRTGFAFNENQKKIWVFRRMQ